MARLTLWYSVQNGGDGSAYPQEDPYGEEIDEKIKKI